MSAPRCECGHLFHTHEQVKWGGEQRCFVLHCPCLKFVLQSEEEES